MREESADRKKRKKSSLRMLARALSAMWRCEPLSLVTAFFLAVFEALTPFGPVVLLYWFVENLEKGTSFGAVLPFTMAGVLALFAANSVRARLRRCIWPHIENCNELSEWAFTEKTLTMDYAWANSQEAAALRARIRNDYDWGCGAFFMIPQFQRLVAALIGLGTSFLLLWPVLVQGRLWQHWSFYVFLFFVAAVTCFTAWFERYTHDAEEKLRNQYDGESSRSHYLMDGGLTYREGKDIRIYQAQPLIQSALEEDEEKQMAEGESRLERHAGAVDGAASGLLLLASYLFIVLRAISGVLSVGSVVLFASTIYRFTEDLKGFSRSWSEIRMNARRMDSSFDYLDLPDRIRSGNLIPLEETKLGEVEFRDVSFSYPGTDQKALSHINLILRPGIKAAVVGMNGSGKTTLIKLLCRLYDPTEGQILLNGIDIREYSYEEYLRLFSVVFQDFRLLSLPIGENVSASCEYDRKRAEKCLEMAGFSPRLARMEKGLDTCLYRHMEDDGVELSGGEAQKVALARALYKDAPIVVLDEPTAALDPISEYEVYSTFHKTIGENTAVFISHRLSSCRFCDEILVFYEGKLVQQGTHEELLNEENGKYYEMWQAQAQYYEEKPEIKIGV